MSPRISALTIFVLIVALLAPGVWAQEAPSSYEQAIKLHRAGKYDEALAAYDGALTSNPRDYGALVGGGLALYASDKFEEAEKRFQTAVQYYPEDVNARLYLGYTNLKLGKFDEAKKEFRLALTRDPDNVSALVGLGNAEYNVGNRFAALDNFKKAEKLQPGNLALRDTIAGIERSNQVYIKETEEVRRYRIKSALNNSIAEAAQKDAEAAAQMQASRPVSPFPGLWGGLMQDYGEEGTGRRFYRRGGATTAIREPRDVNR